MRQSIFTTTTTTAAGARTRGRRRPRAGFRGMAALTAAALLSVTAGGTAVADELWNTIDGTSPNYSTTIDTAPELVPLAIDGTATVQFRIQAKGVEFDGIAGCNVSPTKPATFAFTSSDPSVATITSPASATLTFTACSSLLNGIVELPLVVKAHAAGSSTFTARVQSSTAPATSFDVAPAQFRVDVAAPQVVVPPPPPADPKVEILHLDKATYVKPERPSPSCRATHPDTGRVVDFPALDTKAVPGDDGLGTWVVKCSYVAAAGVPAVVVQRTYEVVDVTAPVVTHRLSTAPDGNSGWFRKDVVLQWGVTEPHSPSSLGTEGCEDQPVSVDQKRTYTCTAWSAGGRSAPVSVTINRDTAAPVVTGSITSAPIVVGGVTWYRDEARVAWKAEDALSGLDSAWSTVGGALDPADNTSVIATEGRNQLARVVAKDVAGNTGGTSVQLVNIDGSAPVVEATPTTAPVYEDWHKGPVDVAVKATDPDVSPYERGSGLKVDPAGLRTLTTSGTHTVTATATDNVGHETKHSVSVKVDATAPGVTATCPASVVKNSSATASWSATDGAGGSGLAGADSGSVTLDTSTVGTSTAVVGAGVTRDNVGHENTPASCRSQVVYDFKGFFAPIDNGVYNQVKAGSAVPVKFSLGDDQGLSVLSGTPLATKVTCQSGVAIDTLEETLPVTTTSGLKYDALANQYNYAWKTATSMAGTCQKLTVKLADGTSQTALFKLVK